VAVRLGGIAGRALMPRSAGGKHRLRSPGQRPIQPGTSGRRDPSLDEQLQTCFIALNRNTDPFAQKSILARATR
jgi:hypothetical protein